MSDLLTRRDLLKATSALAAGLFVGPSLLAGCRAGRSATGAEAEAAPEEELPGHRCEFFEQLPGKKIKCKTCPRECVVGDRERGFCGSRENRGGVYYTLVYGRAAALNLDPIEKKPLFHFLPGSGALSIGTAGCNMDCKDCQNWELSQRRPEQVQRNADLPPEKLAALAQRNGAPVLAYTYTEPVTFYEYMHDAAKVGRARGLKSVMISNGYIQAEPMKQVCQVLDAVKVDLKSFRPDFYVKYCRGTLPPVLETIKLVHKLGKWLELVYLVVPTLNDKSSEIAEMCRWIKKTIGPDVPLHFSRFSPEYQLKNLPPTPYETLERARRVARQEGLHYVYLGNVPGEEVASTVCPKCKRTIVRRNGFQVLSLDIAGGKCKFCGQKIPGVWA